MMPYFSLLFISCNKLITSLSPKKTIPLIMVTVSGIIKLANENSFLQYISELIYKSNSIIKYAKCTKLIFPSMHRCIHLYKRRRLCFLRLCFFINSASYYQVLLTLVTFLRILSIPDSRFLTLPGSLSSVSNMWCQEEVFPLHYAFRNGHE